MEILVIGLGSMGRRRIRLLKEIYPNINITGVDTKKERAEQVNREFGINTFCDLTQLLMLHKFDAVFISTAPLSHSRLINICLINGLHVFTEINLVTDGYDENIELSKKNNLVLFLSSTFLYRNEITYIKDKVGKTNKTKYNYHVGQYLPDWHPWENYNEFFVGEKRTNGCREILGIELPWIVDVFGEIDDIYSVSDKFTSLNIQYNDAYSAILKHKNGNIGTLNIDIISRKPIRNLEIFNENLYISWDGTPFGLYDYNLESKTDEKINLYNDAVNLEGYQSFVIENAYKKEIIDFFDVIAGNCIARYSFEKDRKTLKYVDEIEKYE